MFLRLSGATFRIKEASNETFLLIREDGKRFRIAKSLLRKHSRIDVVKLAEVAKQLHVEFSQDTDGILVKVYKGSDVVGEGVVRNTNGSYADYISFNLDGSNYELRFYSMVYADRTEFKAEICGTGDNGRIDWLNSAEVKVKNNTQRRNNQKEAANKLPNPSSTEVKNKLKDAKICFTGPLMIGNRARVFDILKMIGSTPINYVTTDTDMLVATRNDSVKFKKAQQYGIPTVSEADFLSALDEAWKEHFEAMKNQMLSGDKQIKDMNPEQSLTFAKAMAEVCASIGFKKKATEDSVKRQDEFVLGEFESFVYRALGTRYEVYGENPDVGCCLISVTDKLYPGEYKESEKMLFEDESVELYLDSSYPDKKPEVTVCWNTDNLTKEQVLGYIKQGLSNVYPNKEANVKLAYDPTEFYPEDLVEEEEPEREWSPEMELDKEPEQKETPVYELWFQAASYRDLKDFERGATRSDPWHEVSVKNPERFFDLPTAEQAAIGKAKQLSIYYANKYKYPYVVNWYVHQEGVIGVETSGQIILGKDYNEWQRRRAEKAQEKLKNKESAANNNFSSEIDLICDDAAIKFMESQNELASLPIKEISLDGDDHIMIDFDIENGQLSAYFVPDVTNKNVYMSVGWTYQPEGYSEVWEHDTKTTIPHQEWFTEGKLNVDGARTGFEILNNFVVDFVQGINSSDIASDFGIKIAFKVPLKKAVSNLVSKKLEEIIAVDNMEEQMQSGVRREMEHTDDPGKALEITIDHLTEDENYYNKIDKKLPREEFVEHKLNRDVEITKE